MKRRAFTVFEVTVALAILATALIGMTQLLAAGSRQQREADRSLAAMLEIDNVAERISAIPYDELTQARLSAIEISPAARHSLSGANLSIELAESAAPELPNKRCNLELSWNSVGNTPRTSRLTTWRYARAEGTP